MGDNSAASAHEMLDRLRQWIRSLAGAIFTAPYLPIALTAFFVVTVITHLAIILMGQPLSYWDDPGNAVGLGIFGEKLALGAAALITEAAIYLAIVTLILLFANYRLALIIWFIAEFTHAHLAQATLSDCYVSRWSPALGEICEGARIGFFWFPIALIIGGLLAFAFQPGKLSPENKKIERGLSRAYVLLSVAWVALMLLGIAFSARKPRYGWIPIEVKGSPPPTRDAEAAYDTRRNRLVMFGGAAQYLGNDQWIYREETWEWDGEHWSNAPSPEHPEGRSGHAMAFDEKRGVIVLFGGVRNDEHLSDTWEWDGKTWVRIYSPEKPSGRSGHEMFYDPVLERVVLYGGYDGKTFYNDAWEWNGKKWARIKLESGSPTASSYALAYDPNQKYALGFLSGLGGTWHWKGEKWTRVYPEIEPSVRAWTTLVYDPSRKLFFLFGGMSNNKTLNDTWMYDGQGWTEYTLSGVKPSPRVGMVIWYDHVRGHIMLFGGINGNTVYQDMWEFIPPDG